MTTITYRVAPRAELTALAERAFLAAGCAPLVAPAPNPRFIDVAADVPDGREDLYAELLDALVHINLLSLALYPLPLLYRAEVRYEREPPQQEIWQSSPVLLYEGTGDCEDLASHRVAELRAGRGGTPEDARVRLTHHTRPDGSRLYHVTVFRADGSIEDPSLNLGMGSV